MEKQFTKEPSTNTLEICNHDHNQHRTIWKDILTGDKMLQCSFPNTISKEFGSACLEVTAKYTKDKKIDLVYAMRLRSIKLSMKGFQEKIENF